MLNDYSKVIVLIIPIYSSSRNKKSHNTDRSMNPKVDGRCLLMKDRGGSVILSNIWYIVDDKIL